MSVHLEAGAAGILIFAGFNSPLTSEALDPSDTALTIHGPDGSTAQVIDGGAISLTKIPTIEGAFIGFIPFVNAFPAPGQMIRTPGEYSAVVVATTDGKNQVAGEAFRISPLLDNLDVSVLTRATQSDIISDAQPFPGQFINAAIDSRATVAQILSDGTPFAGALIDASISSRAVPGDSMAITAASITAIWDELVAGHVTPGTFAVLLTNLTIDLALVLADTNELQTDWEDGGRLDLLQDAIKAVTDVILDDGVGGPTYDRAVASLAELRVRLDGQDSALASLASSVSALSNAVRFKSEVPPRMDVPATGSNTFRIHFLLLDAVGAPLDPDDQGGPNSGAGDIVIKIEDLAGGNLIGAPDVFMTRTGVGIFFFDFIVASTAPFGPGTAFFDWLESTSPLTDISSFELVDDQQQENTIIAELLLIKTETDKIQGIRDITDEIPDYVQSQVSIPALMVRPTARTQLDMELGLAAGATDVIVDDAQAFPDTGYLRIKDEIIIYTKIDNQNLLVTRGQFTTADVLHADNAEVFLVTKELAKVAFNEAKFETITPISGTVDINTEDGNLFVGGPTHAAAVLGDELQYTMLIDFERISGFGTSLQLHDVSKNDDTNVFFAFTLVDPTTFSEELPIGRGAAAIVGIATAADIRAAILAGGDGAQRVDEDGFFDSDGLRELWTDDLAGPVRDGNGNRVDNAIVTFFRVDSLDQVVPGSIVSQTLTDSNGLWGTFIDPGRYFFTIRHDGLDFGPGLLREVKEFI